MHFRWHFRVSNYHFSFIYQLRQITHDTEVSIGFVKYKKKTSEFTFITQSSNTIFLSRVWKVYLSGDLSHLFAHVQRMRRTHKEDGMQKIHLFWEQKKNHEKICNWAYKEEEPVLNQIFFSKNIRISVMHHFFACLLV